MAVGVIVGLADGIVRDDVDDEILGAVVGNLVRFAGMEEKGVAGFDGRCAVLMTNNAFAGDYVVKLLLRTVGVIGVGGLARRNAANFNVEGMALLEVG